MKFVILWESLSVGAGVRPTVGPPRGWATEVEVRHGCGSGKKDPSKERPRQISLFWQNCPLMPTPHALPFTSGSSGSSMHCCLPEWLMGTWQGLFHVHNNEVFVTLLKRYNTTILSSALVTSILSIGSDISKLKRSTLTPINFDIFVFLNIHTRSSSRLQSRKKDPCL